MITSGNTTFDAELVKRTTWPIRLYHIGGTIDLYYTDADRAVVWSGQVYEPRGMSYQKIQKRRGLETDTFTITLDNIDDALISWAATADQRGYITTAYKALAWPNLDANGRIQLVGGTAIQLFTGKNTAFKASEEFELAVTANLDFHRQRAPRAMQDVSCRFRFKDANCGYTGAATECNYTKARCKELNNFARFGGFPDLNSKRNG